MTVTVLKLALLAAAGGGGGGGGSNGGSAANGSSSGTGAGGGAAATASGGGAGTVDPSAAVIRGSAALGAIKNANVTAYDAFGNGHHRPGRGLRRPAGQRAGRGGSIPTSIRR